MYTVYVLEDINNKIYKGCTNNLERRLYKHRTGHTKTTKKMDDLRVIYTEKYDSFKEARKRERYLKTATGRRFLKTKLGR